MTKTLSRRALLAGSLGATLALPALEIMAPRRASAAGTNLPGRMVLAFGGLACHAGRIVPSGASMASTAGLAPLFARDVADEATIVSNLSMPWGSPGPSAWTRPAYHESAAQLVLCGKDYGKKTFGIAGPTADGILASALGTKAECFRTQAQRYGGLGAYSSYSLSWIPGESQCRPPSIDPWEVYASADYTGVTEASADEEARRAYLKKRGLSVLDLVGESRARLEARIGAADRARLDAYFTELRALEEQIKATDLGGTCSPLDGFPTSGDGYDIETVTFDGISTQHAHERERASLHARLIAFALRCNVRRSVSFSVSLPQTYMTAYSILAGTAYDDHSGRAADIHQWGHTYAAEEEAHTLFYAWHVDIVAELATLLRDIKEVHPTEGEVSLLDSTAVLFANEAGWGPGLDHEVDSAHSTENMILLSLGGRLLGMRRGAHVTAGGEHPASLMLGAMRAIAQGDGLDGNALVVGDVTDASEALFI